MEEKKLKVYSIFKELDHNGKVITRKLETEIPWENYNPEKFMMEVLKNGDLTKVPRPFSGYHNVLMKKYFNIDEHEKVWRPFVTESEVVNGMRFVFQRKSDSCQVMKWEWVDEK